MTTSPNGPTLSLGIAERIIIFSLAIGTVVVSVGGNFVLGNWRLSQLEARQEKVELRQDEIQNVLAEWEAKTDINGTKMDAKLDMLVDHLNRLEKWADEGFDERKNSGALKRIR